MRLRHLHANGTAANNQEMIWPRAQIEYCFICIIGHLAQARDGRHEGAGAGGDYDSARGDHPLSCLDLCGGDKMAIILNHRHAQALKPFYAVMRRDLANDRGHKIFGLPIADRILARRNTHGGIASLPMRHSGSGQQGF